MGFPILLAIGIFALLLWSPWEVEADVPEPSTAQNVVQGVQEAITAFVTTDAGSEDSDEPKVLTPWQKVKTGLVYTVAILGGLYMLKWLYNSLVFTYRDHIVITHEDQTNINSSYKDWKNLSLNDAGEIADLNAGPEGTWVTNSSNLTTNYGTGKDIDGKLYQYNGYNGLGESVMKYRGDEAFELWADADPHHWGKRRICEEGFKKSSGSFNWFGKDYYDHSNFRRCGTYEQWVKQAENGSEKTIPANQPGVFNNQRTLPHWSKADIDRAFGTKKE